MPRINIGRMILSGLVAGLVINIGEFLLNMPVAGKQFDAAMEAMGAQPVGVGAIILYMLMAFGLGLLATFVYAGIRPRFGPGARTAVIAGLVAWALASAYPLISLLPQHILPGKLVLLALVWEVVEFPLATVIGARLYQEEVMPSTAEPAV